MAMNALQQNTVTLSMDAAKIIVEQLSPLIDRLDKVYNSQNGVKTTIDQAGLDSVSSFSGLTKAQLDNGIYALTATLKSSIDAAFDALVALSARS